MTISTNPVTWIDVTIQPPSIPDISIQPKQFGNPDQLFLTKCILLLCIAANRIGGMKRQ